jgi:amino acid adenylation domain-containing protein
MVFQADRVARAHSPHHCPTSLRRNAQKHSDIERQCPRRAEARRRRAVKTAGDLAPGSQPGVLEILSNTNQSLSECFEQIVRIHGLRRAIGSGAWRPNYRELNSVANALAQSLIASGGKSGDRAAILMRYDSPQIAAVLAALKAARVVVVLNPTDPPGRLSEILADAEPTAILTDEPNHSLAEELTGKKLAIISCEEIFSASAGENLNLKIAPDALAFLLYTSGSTGRPKGVMQTHCNLIHNALRLTRGMNLHAADRINLLASLSGGAGVLTAWSALLNGAALCPFAAMEKGVTGLAAWTREHQISVYISSVSLFRNFMRTLEPEEIFPHVRAVRLVAESGTSEDFAEFKKHFRNDCVLVHSLSSSETGNISQVALTQSTLVAEGRLPAGHAAPGIEILLLDENGRETAAGETGEIVIQSRFISPGYWRNETLTAQKFFRAPDGTPRFHTGDLGRLDSDGLLFHAGRKDAQVKIRGYRIELSEIEDALKCLPQIENAAVCVDKTSVGDAQLIAFIIARDETCDAKTLRDALRGSLPGYMTPSGFIFLKKFPLAPSGKIDREALRQIQPPESESSGEPPAGEIEKMLAEIWKQIFNREFISRRDNFFDLGGDSLNAAVIAAKIFHATNVELPLRAFTDFPTLAELACAIEKQRARGIAPGAPKLTHIVRNGPLPMSFEQERTWRHAVKCKKNSDQYTVATAYRLRGALDAGILHECLDVLARRHEMLRTTFDEIAGKPAQIIHPAAPMPMPQFDFSGAPGAEEKANQLLRNEAREPFDLRRGPLIRFTLAKIRDDEHRLLSTAHHIILDASSWKIFFRELAEIYEARQRGETPPQRSDAPQYADYAVRQRETMRREQPLFRETIEWWRELSSRGKPRATKLPLRRLLRRSNANPGEGLIWWGVDPATSLRLDHIGRESRATFFSTRLAVFAALAAAESHRKDLIFGTYATNRNRIELQNMFGFFVNLTVLRLNCDLSRTFRDWLATVRDSVLETQSHAEIPYEILCDELRAAGVQPMKFRIIFGVSDHTSPSHFGGLELNWLERRMETTPSGFTVTFDQHNEAHRCWIAFDARIYAPGKVRKFIERLKKMLDAVSLNPDLPLAEIVTRV